MTKAPGRAGGGVEQAGKLFYKGPEGRYFGFVGHTQPLNSAVVNYSSIKAATGNTGREMGVAMF